MMLMQPAFVTEQLVAEARQKIFSKVETALLEHVRFEPFAEGICVQFLHIGPYEGMDGAMEQMLAFAELQGYVVPAHNAHDIYLNDVRKTKPENLKSIMRLSVVCRDGRN